MGKRIKKQWQRYRVWLLASLTAFLCVVLPVIVTNPIQGSAIAQTPLQQGRTFYQSGQYAAAIQVLQQAVVDYQAQGDDLQQAIALSNLSLSHQQLGQWPEAEQAITSSLALLQSLSPEMPNLASALAQALTVQGRLQLTTGQAQLALETFNQVGDLYQQLNDPVDLATSQINQAQALLDLGFYPRAREALNAAVALLQTQPDSTAKALALRSLGDIQRAQYELEESQQSLEESLAIATRLDLPELQAEAQLSLANTLRSVASEQRRLNALQSEIDATMLKTLQLYKQAAFTTTSDMTRVRALLNQLSFLISLERWSAAETLAPLLQPQLEQLPNTRTTIYQQIDYANHLMRLNQELTTPDGETPFEWTVISDRLTTAYQQAEALNDQRAKVYALGSLGTVYEQTNQFDRASELTEQALVSSESVNAPEIAYRWQWQLGRLRRGQNDRAAAIAAYESTLTSLNTLRDDLAKSNPNSQFSFRDSIEPIHRQFVDLLLSTSDANQMDLEKAREAIESLQLSELDNFFREACTTARKVQIEQIDTQAAVIYPILLEDRLEVILSLPNSDAQMGTSTNQVTPSTADDAQAVVAQPASDAPQLNLRRHTITGQSRQDIENQALTLLDYLKQEDSNTFAQDLSQQFYTWLVRPFEADLEAHSIQTLVFVPDGTLRNIPMSVLSDGDSYLIQKYQVVTTPGLQLLESQPLEPENLSVLIAGISEPIEAFSALKNVPKEIEAISSKVSSRVFLNADFTKEAFQTAVNDVPAPVVHLATHGVFSSQEDSTYLLTSDGRIYIDDLSQLIQTSDVSRRRPIDLLVLSACETAAGDNRASLGLAGVAIRSGARSTMASLWKVDDASMAELLGQFYQELVESKVTKAEALRRAQLLLIENEQFNSPYFWSPLILIGSWL
jgi:CHAT domain-containing protein/predicted  nucleic acid-binding Zn-ribbon protein